MEIGDLVKSTEIDPSFGYGIVIGHDKYMPLYCKVYWFWDSCAGWIENHYLQVINESR